MAGLFVYDIFWVFFTHVMVTVAKSFEAPIKLLFPTADSARLFSMLGLGDIVIPAERRVVPGSGGEEFKFASLRLLPSAVIIVL
ncbi:signal peptide peptidase 1 [Medicago truncatula]|uniref:signal peptide peptidase 1 n=1 Tax=Medicago truncatula TaxID=3880 RepID=UPI000D2F2DFE|nr:signal peptide peptidase 1 [Medicago truncatula]